MTSVENLFGNYGFPNRAAECELADKRISATSFQVVTNGSFAEESGSNLPQSRLYRNKCRRLAIRPSNMNLSQQGLVVKWFCLAGLYTLIEAIQPCCCGISPPPVSFAIARRTKKLGVRLALGAQRSHIVWIAVRATLATVASGIVFGLLLHLSLERALRHWTPASASTPRVLLSVTLLLLVCSMIACLLSARRAANLDPIQTLRTD